jgi:hypothetical protein
MWPFRRRSISTAPPPDPDMQAVAEILEMNRPDMIVEMARELVLSFDPNGCVQLLVGYKNMKHIMLPVSKELRAKQIKEGMGGELCPDSIAGMAGMIANTPPPDEPSRRRSYWFLGGLLLMRAEEIAADDLPTF